MKKPRPLLNMLLALLLLVSQHAAFAHWVAHGISGQHVSKVAGKAAGAAKSGLVSVDQACQECLFMAHAGSAPVNRALSFTDGQAASDRCPRSSVLTVAGQNPSPFRSRAPPLA